MEEEKRTTAYGQADMEKLLNDIKRNTSWAFRLQCISALCIAGIFIALFVCTLGLMRLIPQVSEVLASVDELQIKAGSAIDEVNTMSHSITATSEKFSGFVDENAETLTQAVQNINNIDFDGLNSAIKDLQEAVEPMAAAANTLKGFSLNPFGR